ncbi:unnamed protein product [Rotaria sp. Silwood2]|nr:unnamed protein product [Rotaria sp. Silwood2]
MTTLANDEDLFASLSEGLEVEETLVVLPSNGSEQHDTKYDLGNNTNDEPSEIFLPMPIHQVASPLLPHISSPTVSNPIRLMEHPYDLPTRMDLVSIQTISVEHHLKTNIPIPWDGNNDFVQISTVINPNPQWILRGYADQHREMEAIVQRLHQLVNETNEQEKRVERETINSINKLISKIWLTMKVEKNQKNGTRFITCLNDLLNRQTNHLLEDFKKSLHDKSRSLVEVGCIRMMVRYDDELKKLTETFLEKKVIEQSFEKMTCAAYSEFNQMLKSEILQQENGIHGDVSKVLDHHLEKLEDQLTSEAVYIGTDKENFTLLSSLLKRSELFCYCDTFGLPLFKESIKILEKIDQHPVVSISTPTGSGKSTLLPLLLTAHGYDKILVTQPRRLACNLLSTRVNDKVKKRISGWAVAGARSKNDSNTQIIYLTDGLLKTYLQLSEGNIFNLVEECKQGINLFDLIERLFKDIKRGEQILCFVKSTSDVYHSIKLLDQLKKLLSYPLVESQSPLTQQKLIAEKQIFFSTTVAQTSLTFPALKYVIDTGIINMPIYDAQTDTTILTELPASHSTITQRKGRVARTQEGEYFPLYNPHVERPDFTTPQIYQTELSDVDFALRKSSEEKDSLETFKQLLPNQLDQAIIIRAHNRLKKLGILVDGKQFTQKGKDIAQLPDFGTLELSTSVHAALNKYNCGRDVILLAAILSVLNTSTILPKLSNKYKRPEEGDYMSLLALMHDLSSQPTSINNPELADIQHYLRRALLRLKIFETYFSNTSTKSEWQKSAKISSDNWYNIAQAFLDGYWENVYISLDRLQGRNKRYGRYSVTPEEFDDCRKQTAVLDRATVISQKLHPECVFARDIICSTAIRTTSRLSFLGIIPAAWLTHEIERKVKVTATEMTKFKEEIFHSIDHHITYSTTGHEIIFKGPTGKVFDTEQHVREQLCNEYKWFLPDKESLKNNSMLRKNMPKVKRNIFMPFLWRWQNEKQVEKMNIEKESPTLLKIVATCREKDAESIVEELNSFFNWLSQCESFQNEQTDNVQPQQLNSSNSGIEQRIKRVTDANRTWADLKQAVSQGTRESRMDVIAWTLVCKFHCKLHGAFVRDRIINNRVSPSSDANPESWVNYERKSGIPVLHSKITPSTIDCHLPIQDYFDIELLLDEIHKYEDIEVKVFRQHCQYVLLFDEKALTGPFIVNLTEPHVALAQGSIDFDIDNLYVEREHPQKLRQRVDLSGPPCSSDLEEIVKKIRMYHFKVLRPIDDDRVRESLKKLKSQGYSQDGPPLTLSPSKSS